jgi:hypothetical protein
VILAFAAITARSVALARSVGHGRLETTRAYTRHADDRAKALDLLPVDLQARPIAAFTRISGTAQQGLSTSR